MRGSAAAAFSSGDERRRFGDWVGGLDIRKKTRHVMRFCLHLLERNRWVNIIHLGEDFIVRFKKRIEIKDKSLL